MTGRAALTIEFLYNHYILTIASIIVVSASLYFFRDKFTLDDKADDT